MKNISKTRQLPHQQTEANESSTPSNQQDTFDNRNKGDRDSNNFKYNTRLGSTSSGLFPQDNSSSVDFQPTLLHIGQEDVVGSVDQQDDHESQVPEVEPRDTSIKVTVLDLGYWSESDKSACSSPVLTPSSSTTSLRSLFQETAHSYKALSSYSASILEIPSDLEAPESKTGDLVMYRGDNDGDNPLDHGRRTTTNTGTSSDPVATYWYEDSLKIGSIFQTSKKNIRRQCRYSHRTFPWSPDEEIRKAQSRFKRYGKGLTTTQMDTSGAAPRIPPVALETISNLYHVLVDSKERRSWPEEEVSWWRWLASMFAKICPARIESIECEGIMMTGNMPGSFEESNVKETARPLQFNELGRSD